MSKVFVVNEPLKSREGERGRAIDLRPAQKYGELVFLSPAGEPPLDPEGWLPRMQELLRDFCDDDFILPVGHPALIVAAASIIGMRAMSLAPLIDIEDVLREKNVHPQSILSLASAIRDNAGFISELSILVWGGREVGYSPVRLPLFPPKENHPRTTNPQSQENV